MANLCFVLVQLHASVEYESTELSYFNGLHCWCSTVFVVLDLEGG